MTRFHAVACVAVLTIAAPVWAQTFDSQSDGSDGALDLTGQSGTIIFDPTTFVPPLDPDGDNVFHFTTITIPAGVTLKLSADKLNMSSVYWLAQGDVTVAGVIDASGGRGYNTGEAPRYSVPGPGGFPGGLGTSPIVVSASTGGFGPGGGSSVAAGGGHATSGAGFPGGQSYGNPFAIPLIGGSGGAGTSGFLSTAGPGGGAGGGAILIASSSSIAVDGGILANGGNGGVRSTSAAGGAGAGGTIRLLAPSISGSGLVEAFGTCGTFFGGQRGGQGRIRLEAFFNQFSGTTNTACGNVTPVSDSEVTLSPNALFLPADLPASIRPTSIAGIAVPPQPTGSFATPDVTINDPNPVSIDIAASNIPIGPPADPVVTIFAYNETDGLQTINTDALGNPLTLTGTQQMSAVMRDVTFSPGFSWVFVTATWTP